MSNRRLALTVISLSVAVALGTHTGALAGARASKPRTVQGGGGGQGVTLFAGRDRLRFGGSTDLHGRIRPAARGETVEILDVDHNRVVGSDTTDADGRYSIRYAPRSNTRLRARWLALSSDLVKVKVEPRVRVELDDVRLFGRSRVSGRVRPSMPGAKITVKLARNGRVVRTKRAPLQRGRSFKARLYVPEPGTYRVRAVLDNPDFLNGWDRSWSREPSLPRLSIGSHNVYVSMLESRLMRLGYYLPSSNWSYDVKTADAMRAFNKVQGSARIGSVDETAWRRLASPRRPRPRFASPDRHIEIDQSRQVIYVVKGGRVRRILHTSTGANGATRDGSFTVHRKLAGYSGNRLYYPSYFDGLRAIHGWPEVPTYPASHGCSRVPMWAATWIYSKAPIGTRVYVYH